MVQDRRSEAADREHTNAVGHDHQPLAVPMVGGQAGGESKQRRGKDPRERDDSCLCRGPGHRQYEQRVGDRARLRAGVREQLPSLKQHEFAVTAQGNRDHAVTLADDQTAQLSRFEPR